MEPALPAPPEQLMPPDELEDALEMADMADGKLPHFLNEQRAPKSDKQIAAEEHEARMERGKAALAKRDAGAEADRTRSSPTKTITSIPSATSAAAAVAGMIVIV